MHLPELVCLKDPSVVNSNLSRFSSHPSLNINSVSLSGVEEPPRGCKHFPLVLCFKEPDEVRENFKLSPLHPSCNTKFVLFSGLEEPPNGCKHFPDEC